MDETSKKVVQFTTIHKMKAHPDYTSAKAGDIEAAYRLMNAILSGRSQQKKIQDIAAKHKGAIIVGVHAEEDLGRNKIPQTAAKIIGTMAGIETENNIVQSNRVERTGANALHRLMERPKFLGSIQVGRQYILIDDVVTGGGTMSELRCYIEENGGKVILMVAVSAAKFSANIALSDETRQSLIIKLGQAGLNEYIAEMGMYDGKADFITESEGRAILSLSGKSFNLA